MYPNSNVDLIPVVKFAIEQRFGMTLMKTNIAHAIVAYLL